jgi:hypothetical protein
MTVIHVGPAGLIFFFVHSPRPYRSGLLHDGASRLNYPVATAPGTDSNTLSLGLLQFAIALLHFDVCLRISETVR